MTLAPPEPSLADKVAFLHDAAFPERDGPIAARETHMSWVFFVDGAVYKLKKPVRLAYLDFSTLERREAACRAEYDLNQPLAPGVYLGVVPIVRTPGGLRLGGDGERILTLINADARRSGRLTICWRPSMPAGSGLRRACTDRDDGPDNQLPSRQGALPLGRGYGGWDDDAFPLQAAGRAARQWFRGRPSPLR
ncbi:MAG: hypothetical protein EPO51_03555 [Phenylobacterium sp.]|uniref:hypothetical protein n=1 Tax=Phenylobacterium sp. TaxID=1871053 RepID=UPI00120C76CF|nr:hypothetical protein [Phenylobacterium sp.]TAJ73923.1 MAG: hypothetical protein EPO51_03555 [Phenylobacterium sp.]